MVKSSLYVATLLLPCSLLLSGDLQAAPKSSSAPVSGVSAKEGALAAQVGNKKITQAQVLEDMKREDPRILEEKNKSPEQFAKLFSLFRDQAVGLTLIGQAAEAVSATLMKNPEVKEALEKTRLQLLIGAYVSDYIKQKVTDAAVSDLFNKLLKERPIQRYSLKHILVDSEATAKAIIKTLEGGKSFEALAKEKSIDKESAKNGGVLPPLVESQLPPVMAQAIEGLKAGGYTKEPVSIMGKWGIFLLDRRENASLEESTPAVKALLSRQFLQELLLSLKGKTKVELYDDNGQPTKEDSFGALDAGSLTGPAKK